MDRNNLPGSSNNIPPTYKIDPSVKGGNVLGDITNLPKNQQTSTKKCAKIEEGSENSNDLTASRNDSEYDISRSKRKPRTVFTRHQLQRLKESFTSKPYLTTDERKNLALELDITQEQIKVWFQNHRSKVKRQSYSNNSYESPRSSNINQNYPQNYVPMNSISMSSPYLRTIPYGQTQTFTYPHNLYPSDWNSNIQAYVRQLPMPNAPASEHNMNVYSYPTSKVPTTFPSNVPTPTNTNQVAASNSNQSNSYQQNGNYYSQFSENQNN